jgi:sterol desaturase/sphingolipid hydroxylase (fatty acid hydroxylase superfamily)
VLTLVAFWALVLATAAVPASRAALRDKGRDEWLLDWANLVVQGIVIPLVLVVGLERAYAWLAPGWHGALRVPAPVAFVLDFVVIDYLYYWNHRMFHTEALWTIHRVHHSVTAMDVFATSRNTLWTSLLIVYVWVNSLFVYLLADPGPYVLAAGLTAALDLWRHSPLQPPTWIARLLRPLFVLPMDHAWHHADTDFHGNYGANLSVWDRMHGTYRAHERAPEKLGASVDLSLRSKLLWPFP